MSTFPLTSVIPSKSKIIPTPTLKAFKVIPNTLKILSPINKIARENKRDETN